MRRVLGVLCVLAGSACFLGGAKLQGQAGYACINSQPGRCGPYWNCYQNISTCTPGGTYKCMVQTPLTGGGCSPVGGFCAGKVGNCTDNFYTSPAGTFCACGGTAICTNPWTVDYC